MDFFFIFFMFHYVSSNPEEKGWKGAGYLKSAGNAAKNKPAI